MSQERKPVRHEDEVYRNLTVKEIAERGGRWQLLDTASLTPGYNPRSQYMDVAYPNFPPDRFGTAVELGLGTVVEVKKVTRPETDLPPVLEANTSFREKLKSLFGRRSEVSLATDSSSGYYHVMGVQVLQEYVENDPYMAKTREAKVFCAPQELPDELLKTIGSGQLVTLTDKLLIKPDYSNLPAKEADKIVASPDLFSIFLMPGAQVLVHAGGSIGNVKLVVMKGEFFVPCNPGLELGLVRPYVETASGDTETLQISPNE